jgi:hypothetical protein
LHGTKTKNKNKTKHTPEFVDDIEQLGSVFRNEKGQYVAIGTKDRLIGSNWKNLQQSIKNYFDFKNPIAIFQAMKHFVFLWVLSFD